MADDLAARLSLLEDLVRELRGELARAQVGGFRSMRDSRRCPACGNGALLHIPVAQEMKEGALVPLAVHHVKRFPGTKLFGTIEYFVCRACRLIESHAKDLDGVIPDGQTIIEIVPEMEPPRDGPFR